MTIVMLLLTIAVVAGVAAVAAGVVSGGLGEPTTPIPARALPESPLTGQDVADLRFVQSFRGYRMDQVDAAMDALAAELDRLRGLLPDEAGAPTPTGSPTGSTTESTTDLTADRLTGQLADRTADPAAWKAERD